MLCWASFWWFYWERVSSRPLCSKEAPSRDLFRSFNSWPAPWVRPPLQPENPLLCFARGEVCVQSSLSYSWISLDLVVHANAPLRHSGRIRIAVKFASLWNSWKMAAAVQGMIVASIAPSGGRGAVLCQFWCSLRDAIVGDVDEGRDRHDAFSLLLAWVFYCGLSRIVSSNTWTHQTLLESIPRCGQLSPFPQFSPIPASGEWQCPVCSAGGNR